MQKRDGQAIRDLRSNVVVIVNDALNQLEAGKQPTRDGAIHAASGGEDGLKRQAQAALELLIDVADAIRPTSGS